MLSQSIGRAKPSTVSDHMVDYMTALSNEEGSDGDLGLNTLSVMGKLLSCSLLLFLASCQLNLLLKFIQFLTLHAAGQMHHEDDKRSDNLVDHITNKLVYVSLFSSPLTLFISCTPVSNTL